MKKVVHGVEKELGLMDFVIDKLSTRLGAVTFNSYTDSDKTIKVDGKDVTFHIFKVKGISTLTNKQISIDLDYITENKIALEELERKSTALNPMFMDFTNCVVGHYCNGNGDFAQVTQTYKAEKLLILSRNQVEKMLKGDEETSQQAGQENK